MNKLIAVLQKVLMPIAGKMNRNRYIKALRDGFVLSLPYTMVGSILVSILNISAFDSILGASMATTLRAFIAPSNSMTNGIVSMFVLIGIANALSKEYKINQVHSITTSLVMYFILCPSFVSTNEVVVKGALSMAYLGAKGIFIAITIAILGVELCRWAVNHKLTIKLPDSVPASIQDSFTSFIPAGIAIFVALIIRQVFLFTSQGNIIDFVFKWLQAPMTNVALSYPSMLLLGLLVNLFWFFGLHGQSIVFSIYNPFLIQASTEASAKIAAGEPLTQIFTKGYTFAFIAFGFWISIPLLIALFLYARKNNRKDWEQVGKIALAPGLFNIYEPLMFGLPLVLNPYAFVPMMLTPIISHTVGYLCTISGIIPYATGVILPITTPIFLSGVLATNSIVTGIIQLLTVIPLATMWYFFLSVQDRSEREQGIYIEEEAEDLNVNREAV